MKQEHDFAWADRNHAEAMAEKHGGVLLALLDVEYSDGLDWTTADDIVPQDKVLGWGVSSEDGENMLDEDEKWCCVA